MYKLTQRRFSSAEPIFEKYRDHLEKHYSIETGAFEHELRDCWDIGYQELKDIIIQLAKNDRYTLLAAYYMQYQNGVGVVSEFQEPLAELYGSKWYDAPDREQKQKQFWERAFASD